MGIITLPRFRWPPRWWLLLQLARQESLRDACTESAEYWRWLRGAASHHIDASEAAAFRHQREVNRLRGDLGLGRETS